MSMSRTLGAIGGALVGGIGLSVLMLAGERKTGRPSELIDLERRGAERVGRAAPPADRLPDEREQVIAQSGHLLLSALAGAAYAAATDEDTAAIPSGVLFGIAFYGVAHWLTGPLLGVKRPEWRSNWKTIDMHAANHVAFGLATAAGAKLASAAAARQARADRSLPPGSASRRAVIA